MSNRPWREQLADFVDGVDGNLRSLRKETAPPAPAFPSLPLSGRAPARNPEAVATARAELSTLLAAVQGSLADLRVEVAAAKRLSTNASAAVAGDMSPVQRPANRSASVQPRPRDQRTATEVTPPLQVRVAAPSPSYALGQPFGPLFSTTPGSDVLAVSPPAFLPVATTPQSIASSSAPQNEELVKAIDQRLLELGHKIERSLERSMEDQSLRAQLQQAVQAANALQQQQLMLRTSAPAQVYSPFGAVAATAAAAAPAGAVPLDAPVAPPPSGVSPASGGTAAGAAAAPVAPAASPSPLVILAMNKADAAEKLALDVRGELQVFQKQAAKDAEDVDKRVAGLQDSSRQHWEKMCLVSSQVDSLLAQRAGSAELQAEVARVAAKLVQLEACQDRTIVGMDEHQRLMRQLTSAMQKVTQEADSEHAVSSSRHGEVVAKLEAAGARMGELEARVARVGDVESRMARLGDVEMKLGRLGELEGRMVRVADVEARVARLPDLEVKMARMGDVESKMSRLGDVESRLGRLGDVEARVARFGDVEARVARMGDLDMKLARLGEVEARLARLGDWEAKLARMGEMEAKLARMGDLEAKLARMGDLEARVARMGEMETKVARMGEMEMQLTRLSDAEAKLARMGDMEARLRHMGDLEARVATLQASVAANQHNTRSPPPPVTVPQPPPGPDLSTQEALRRLSALEQQVARLAAAEQSSQVQERDRRRGHPQPPPYPSSDGGSMRSPDGHNGAPNGLFSGEAIVSPASPARISAAAAVAVARHSDTAGRLPPRDMEERVRVLENMVLQGSFGNTSSRSMQSVMARVERLEQIVRAENSIEAMAQEARLAVTEEFVLELRRDFHDVVGPTLEKLAAHVSELRKGQGQASPDNGRFAAELRVLSSRVEHLDGQVNQLAAGDHGPASISPTRAAPRSRAAHSDTDAPGGEDFAQLSSAMLERLTTLELQVRELNTAVEDNASIYGRLQRHQALLEKMQHDMEVLRASITAEVQALKAGLATAEAAVGHVQGDVVDAREQLAALVRLDEQVEEVSRALQGLTERLGGQEDRVAELEQQQREVLEAQEGKAADQARGEVVDAAVQSLAERLGGQEGRVLEMGEQQAAADAVMHSLTERLGEQEDRVADIEEQQKATEAAVRSLTERLGGQEGKVAVLEEQQHEQQKTAEAALAGVQGLTDRLTDHGDDRKAAEAVMQKLAERVDGHDGKIGDLTKQQRDQQKAAEAAVTSLTKRLGGQDGRVTELEEQSKVAKAAIQSVTERLGDQEGKLSALEEQQSRAEAASVAAAGLAMTAAGGAAAAGAGAEAMSRSLDAGALQSGAKGSPAVEPAEMAALEELAVELRAKLADLRTSIGDVRKELGSKLQVLDAQTQELLAFREEVLSSYVELQDGVERTAGLAEDAAHKVESQEAKLQELSEQVEAKTRSSADSPSVTPAAFEDLQQRVSASASEQQERLEALDAKVHALSELLTAVSQDSQAASEARTRAEELAYDLSQVQESLETLALDSGRLAQQLASVEAAGDKNADQLGAVSDDVAFHTAAISQLKDELQRLGERVSLPPAAAVTASASPRDAAPPRSPLPLSEVGDDEGPRLGGGLGTAGGDITPARLSVTLPATRTSVPASQAILNPLYSSSSEDMVFAGVPPTSSPYVPTSQQQLQSTPSQPAPLAQPVFSPAPLSAGGIDGGRIRQLDSLPQPLPPLLEQTSVRDKALYYELLAASKNNSEGGLPRRSTANSAQLSEGPSQDFTAAAAAAAAAAAHPHVHNQPPAVAAESSEAAGAAGDPMSPGAAATAATGGVGLAGLRQAVQAAGASRSLPETPTGSPGPAARGPEPVAAAGALAAVRAARSGLGLSGDLSSPKARSPAVGGAGQGDGEDQGEGGVEGSPGGAASPSVFGPEQTFRRGVADEELSVSSGDEGDGTEAAAGAGGEGARNLGREQTFRRGGADEEVSISSDDEDKGERKMMAGTEGNAEGGIGEDRSEPAGDAGVDFDDEDDDLDLAGLAPPPPLRPTAAAATALEAAGTAPELPLGQPNPAEGKASVAVASDSGDIDEDIELEPGINPSGFDYDDEDDEVWPGAAVTSTASVTAPPPAVPPASQGQAGPSAPAGDTAHPDTRKEKDKEPSSIAAPKTDVPAAEQAPSTAAAAPSAAAPSAPDATEGPQLQPSASGAASHLSASGAAGGSHLAPLQLSSSAAAMLSMSGELSRRKLPPLAPLGALPSVGSTSGATGSLGPVMAPPFMRASLSSLQNSANMSGNLSGDLPAPLGESSSSRAPLPPLRGAPLPPLGSTPSTVSSALPAAPTSAPSANLAASASQPANAPATSAPPAPAAASTTASKDGAIGAKESKSGSSSSSSSSSISEESVFSGTSLSDLHGLGPDDGAGEAAAPPAAPPPPAASTAASGAGLPPAMEPVSPLRSLMLSQPMPQEHPAEFIVDTESHMPALPGATTDTSGSILLDATGDMSALSREASIYYQSELAPQQPPPPPAPAPLPSTPLPPSPAPPTAAAVLAPTTSNRGLASLLDSDSDSFHGDHLAAVLSRRTLSANSNGGGLGAEGSPAGGAFGVRPSAGGFDALTPSPRTTTLSPQASRSAGLAELLRPPEGPAADATFFAGSPTISRGGSPGGSPSPAESQDQDRGNTRSGDDSAGPVAPEDNGDETPEVAAEAATVNEDYEDYDEDFDEGAASPSPRGASPAVTGAPSAVSLNVSPDRDDDQPAATAAAADTAFQGEGQDYQDQVEDNDDNDSDAPKVEAPQADDSNIFGADDDGGLDLELPGMGDVDGSRGLAASDSLTSLDALAPPPAGPAKSSTGADATAIAPAPTASRLPPLPPGARRSADLPPLVAAATAGAQPAAPTSTASRVSILTSEDSLALIAPPEGAGGGLLEDGSEDEDIFAGSAEVDDVMGSAFETGAPAIGGLSRSSSRLSAGEGGPAASGLGSGVPSSSLPPLPPLSQRSLGREFSMGSRGDGSRLRQSLEQTGLSIEQSTGSIDFNGELSVEAERVAAMLTNERPSTTDDFSADPVVPPVRRSGGGLMSIYGPSAPSANASASASGRSPSGGTGTRATAAYAPAAGVANPNVHGSLDFHDEEDEKSSSSGDSGSGRGSASDRGPAAGNATTEASEVAGRSGLTRTYSDSSMELEVFRPPPSQSQPHPASQPSTSARSGGAAQGRELAAVTRPSRSGDGDDEETGRASASGSRWEQELQHQQRHPAVPATPFTNSLGDMSTSSGAYRLQVMTGSRAGAGCSGDGAVRVTLYGNQSTHVAQLRPLARSARYSASAASASASGWERPEEEYFAAGSVEEFMVDSASDLGDLAAVYIWHEGEGFSASWYVESVTVEQLMTGLEWTFDVNDWVRGGRGGGRIVRLPGAPLSVSRENSLARLAGTSGLGSEPNSPVRSPAPSGGAAASAAAATRKPPPPGVTAYGAGSSVGAGAPQRRGMAALGDESLDVSSDMPSPVDYSAAQHELPSLGGRSNRGSDGLPPIAPGARQLSPLEAAYKFSAARISAERSGGNAGGGVLNSSTRSGSVHFSEEDDDNDLLPGMGSDGPAGGHARSEGGSAGSSSRSVFEGARVAASAAGGGSVSAGQGAQQQPRVAANVPAGIGLVLEEDIEEVDGMLSNSAAFSLGPVSSRSGAAPLISPALVSPRPPLPPGAPRPRRDISDELDDASSDLGALAGPLGAATRRQQALPPTPPLNRRNSGGTGFGTGGRRLSGSALEAESSHDSFSGGGAGHGAGGFGSRRRVRISGGGDDDLTSELSVEGSELSIASAASLSLYAPDGVRPPPLGGAIGVDYVGTSRKRVSWAEYAEELEFLRDGSRSSGSVASLSEEDILAAQGETVRPDASRVGYDDLIRGGGSRALGDGSTTAASRSSRTQPLSQQQDREKGGDAEGDGGGFMDVPLKQRRGQHANSYGYKIKIFTADKLNAGLGNSTVHLELLGRDATVAQALPKERGTFQRGCVDCFTLYSTSGDMGQLLALKVWHEGKTLGPGNWGFEQVVIDDRLKGNRYVFRNPDLEGVLRKGRRHCLVLKPAVSRIDESEDLAEVAREYETQLSANRDLNESERAGLRGKLDRINQRLSKLGTKLVRSVSGSFGFK